VECWSFYSPHTAEYNLNIGFFSACDLISSNKMFSQRMAKKKPGLVWQAGSIPGSYDHRLWVIFCL